MAFSSPHPVRPASGQNAAAQRSPLRLSILAISASVLFAQMHTPLESQVTGLVAAYGFNEGAGTSFADASGNNNSGTVSGATWAAGRFGSALSFDGINDIATVPDSASLDVSAGVTLEAWVYLVARNSWRTILMKERPGHMVYGLYANTDTNRPSGEIVDDERHQRCPRHGAAAADHVDARRGHVRWGHAAALRQRCAGAEPARERRDCRLRQSAPDRR